jgi:hypothetical protein
MLECLPSLHVYPGTKQMGDVPAEPAEPTLQSAPEPQPAPQEPRLAGKPQRRLTVGRIARGAVGPLIGAALAIAGRWIYDTQQSSTVKRELLNALVSELASQVDRAYGAPYENLTWRGDTAVQGTGSHLPPTPVWRAANQAGTLGRLSPAVATVLEEAYDRLGALRQLLERMSAAALDSVTQSRGRPFPGAGYPTTFDSLRLAAIGTSLFAMAAIAREYHVQARRATFRIRHDGPSEVLVLEFNPQAFGVRLIPLRVLGPWPRDCERGSVAREPGILIFGCSAVASAGKVF